MQQRNSYLVSKVFKSYWMASVFASLVTTLGIVIDGIIVGQLLGPSALAAINLSMPLLQFIATFYLLINEGCAIFTAFAMGKGNQSEASRYFSFAVMANMVVGVMLLLTGLFFSNQVATILCNDIELLPLVHKYIRIVLLTVPLYLMLPGLCVFVRTDGRPGLTTIALVIASITNITLDIVFIKYFEWGIAGSSIATSISYAVGIIIVLSHFFNKRCSLKICNPTKKIAFFQLFMTGTPVALSSVLTTIVLWCLNYIVLGSLGMSGVAILAVCLSMSLLVSMFISGTLDAMQPVGAVLIGQEDFKGLRFVVKKSMMALLCVITGLVLYVELFPGTILSMFGLTGETATNTLRIVALCFLPSVITYLTMTVYQLTQRHKLAITIAIIQPLMVIPIMYLLAHINENLIWVSFVSSELIVLAIILSLSEYVHRSNKSLSRWMLLPAAASDETSIDISMECTEEDLSRFMPQLDAFLASFEVSPVARNRVELCCEELLLNMIHYSGPDGKTRRADLMLRVSDRDINICIRDNGCPFDPVNYSKKVGTGLLIVRGVCQKLEYKYQFNQNTIFIKIDKNKQER